MKSFARFTAVVVLLLGIVSGLFDLVYLILKLIQHSEWTAGSYHQPVLTALYLFGGSVCALVSILVVVAVVHAGRRALVNPLIPMVLAGAVAGLWLPFIHVNEVDVASSGFRQALYATGTEDRLTLYNATSSAVTVCLGSHGICRTEAADGPLPAAGLTLQPGQATTIAFRSEGIYPLTIVGPPTTMTATDTVVHSSAPFCDNNAAQACICGPNGC